VQLCELPFWASDEDLERLGNDLEQVVEPARSIAKYAAAPSASGKTASGLVGFLASAERDEATSFTHYLYLASDNNHFKNFNLRRSSLADDEDDAKAQGAAFALECLTRLLDAQPGPHLVTADPNLRRQKKPTRL